MSNFYRAAIFAFVIFIASNTFANPADNEIKCPPVSMISNIKFKQAARFDDGWLVGAKMHYKHQKLQVIFGFPWEGITSSQKALKRGQELFNKKVILSDPKVDHESGKAGCVYASYNPYIVWAEVSDS